MASVSTYTPSTVALFFLYSIILYITWTFIYRLYISPLARVPGPILAALTGWYEVYYDIVQPARFPWKIHELHQKYGPVVRLTPYEVHVSDPLYADTHFSASPSARWDQYRPHEWSFGFPEATFSTVDHDIHKLRRGAFSNMFSKRKIAALEPMIVGKVRTLCARLEAIRGSTSTVDLRCVFTCLTTDIITEYALGRSYNLLATADFSPRWRSVFATGLRNVHRFKHFPFLWTIIRAVPESWVTYIDPDFKLTLDYQRDMKSKIETVVTEHAIGEKTSQPTIFHEILDSSLPAREKASSRLQQEGESVLGAGTETTSNTLNVIIFLLLTHPEKLRRVKDELRNTASLSWQELESLPYLTATIQEGLRLALGVSSRLIRVGPDRELRYREYVFPPGTPISMSVLPLHFNAAIFSDPSEFLPERWLERSNSVTRGDLFAFSKGPRMCIGINLAYAELYLTLGHLLQGFDFQLFETTKEDVNAVYDAFVPMPKEGSKGVRVLVQ